MLAHRFLVPVDAQLLAIVHLSRRRAQPAGYHTRRADGRGGEQALTSVFRHVRVIAACITKPQRVEAALETVVEVNRERLALVLDGSCANRNRPLECNGLHG